ncbi:uncharacterized protein LOC131597609 [Vicia villosa]|uniref:uncharacterized protein LOC131597609 n=1 Tax=Vicia villosa TaxID=3911 RepID=UPI00273BE4D9|nr:uncharacterized protein LOC131597609 [Vicia villosa]
MSINDLLSPNGKFWNSMLIRELFDYVVVEDILQVPLVEEVQEDKWNWKEEQNGCYSVRSGYRLWRKEHVRLGSSGVDGDWCSLWNIKAPPRTKHLLWRICRDCLPTRLRLRHYHVSCPSSCSFCEDTMEDSWHVFFGCNATNHCWQITGLSHIIYPRLQIFHDVKSLILDICSKEDSMIAGRVAVMLVILWRNRNNMVWNNEKEEYSKLVLNAFCSWQEWFLA